VTGDPVQGATVTVTGFGDQYTAVTGADGTYTIGATWGMYPGTYPKVVAQGPGYLAQSKSVTVPEGGPATADFVVDHDWAEKNGGAQIADFNGLDFTPYGCGPVHAIDGNLGTGWVTVAGTTEDTTGTFVPKHITVELPNAVDVTSFGVNPSPACGLAGSASTGDYSIEVSPDNSTWVTVADGHFSPADRGKLNTVEPTVPAKAVKFVRFTIKGNQVPDVSGDSFETVCGDPSTAGGYDGCTYAALTEMAVFGTATK